jgi:tRNA1Val (adenine37-N6)-methyltransferase
MNQYFQFRQFRINQEKCAMKVATDSCLFGAWVASLCGDKKQVLDIGAGTGLLSLMIAQACNATIEAVEIEAECYVQLKENIAQSPWHERIKCRLEDIREFEPSTLFDLIISNPPFYEKQLRSPVAPVNAARHSSDLTLEELLNAAKDKLGADGWFAILLPYYRHEELIALASRSVLYPAFTCYTRHSARHAWYRTMVIFTTNPVECVHKTIDVRSEDGSYSPAFREMLSPYYL